LNPFGFETFLEWVHSSAGAGRISVPGPNAQQASSRHATGKMLSPKMTVRDKETPGWGNFAPENEIMTSHPAARLNDKPRQPALFEGDGNLENKVGAWGKKAKVPRIAIGRGRQAGRRAGLAGKGRKGTGGSLEEKGKQCSRRIEGSGKEGSEISSIPGDVGNEKPGCVREG